MFVHIEKSHFLRTGAHSPMRPLHLKIATQWTNVNKHSGRKNWIWSQRRRSICMQTSRECIFNIYLFKFISPCSYLTVYSSNCVALAKQTSQTLCSGNILQDMWVDLINAILSLEHWYFFYWFVCGVSAPKRLWSLEICFNVTMLRNVPTIKAYKN